MRIVTWILSGLLALVFLASGGAKLTSQAMPVGMFASFGLPAWFMYVTGCLEIAAAILVLVPRVAYIGAGIIVCIMVSALYFHLAHGQAGMIVAPLILLVIAVAVGSLRGWGRRSGLSLSRAA